MKTRLNAILDPTRLSNDAREFETALRRKIVGQEPAIEKISEIYQMFLAGLNPPGRPVGNLLFLGPTGSRKTRVVEAMAEALFGDPHACIKLDCAEFQHSHEIANMTGSPHDRPRNAPVKRRGAKTTVQMKDFLINALETQEHASKDSLETDASIQH